MVKKRKHKIKRVVLIDKNPRGIKPGAMWTSQCITRNGNAIGTAPVPKKQDPATVAIVEAFEKGRRSRERKLTIAANRTSRILRDRLARRAARREERVGA